MATPLNGTVIITGANGSLGSKIALKIAQEHPFVHLLLTARDVCAKSVVAVSEKIRSLGPRSFEIATLDLASFHSIQKFTKSTVQRVRSGDIPSIQLLINSAALASFKADAPTEDGFDLVYQTNCLGPFLLTTNLLEAFRANRDGSGARVINIGSALMSLGRSDFFHNDHMSSKKVDSSLSAREGLVRYGSSKLLLNAAMYALRRSLMMTSRIILTVFTLDPGRIASTRSRLTSDAPIKLRLANGMLSGVRPLTQVFSRRIINNASRSADAVVKVAFDPLRHDIVGSEKYFLLDDEYCVKDMVPVTNDVQLMHRILRRVIMNVGVIQGDMMSPA